MVVPQVLTDPEVMEAQVLLTLLQEVLQRMEAEVLEVLEMEQVEGLTVRVLELIQAVEVMVNVVVRDQQEIAVLSLLSTCTNRRNIWHIPFQA